MSTPHTVLVTGAASGIGAAAVQQMAAQGMTVYAVDRDGDSLARVVQDSSSTHGTIVTRVMDVSDPTQIHDAIVDVYERFGRLDGVYSNAGVQFAAAVHETSPTQWQRVIDVNVRAYFLLIAAAAPRMAEGGGGSIVGTASISGLVGQYHRAAYTAAKGAVIALTRAAALDYARKGVRINCVIPGVVDTPMLHRMAGTDDAGRARVLAQRAATNPIGRLVQADEVAAAALFLLDPRSSGITGTSIVVDGGLTAGFAAPT